MRASLPRLASRSRLAPVLLPILAPWSVQVFSRADVTLLFPWGLVNTNPPGLTTLYHFPFVYTAGLPGLILAWPVSVVLYLVAVASVVAGLAAGACAGDRRVTAAALVCAGVAQCSLAWGFSVRPYRTAWPTGAVVLRAVVAALVRR